MNLKLIKLQHTHDHFFPVLLHGLIHTFPKLLILSVVIEVLLVMCG